MEAIVLKFDECFVGMKTQLNVEITERMIESFQDITGDFNPLHTKKDYAERQGFEGTVVYGMLTASFLSTLVGMYIPGKYCIIQEVNLKFPQPVYVGEKLNFSVEIIEKNDSVRQLVLKIKAQKESGKTVLRGQMKVGVLKEVE